MAVAKKKKERLERKIKIKKQGKASKLRASSPFSGVYLHWESVSFRVFATVFGSSGVFVFATTWSILN